MKGSLVFGVLIIIGFFTVDRSHADYVTEQQRITGCSQIRLHPPVHSGCICQENACATLGSANLFEYKSCDEVLPGQKGQLGCKSVFQTVGTKGACRMAINNDVDEQASRCLALVFAEGALAFALTPPPANSFAMAAVMAIGAAQCHNDYDIPPCLMFQCVQDPNFRLEIMQPLATGFDQTLPPASRECYGSGGGDGG